MMKRAATLLSRLGLTPDSFYDQSQAVGQVGTWIYACDTEEYWWSAAVYRMYGITKSTPLVKELFFNSIVPEDRPAVIAAFVRLTEGGPYCVVYRVERGGKTRWLEQKARLYRGPKYPIPYVVGMVRDVTELKTEQLRLERRRADFAAITSYLAETTDTTDLRAIVASVKQTIRRRLEVAAIAVFVRRGEEIFRVIPRGRDPLRAFEFQDVHDFVGYRATLNGQFSTSKVNDYPNPVGRESLLAAGGVTVVALPIRHGKKAIGALSVVLKREEGLNREERDFCRTICGYLSNQLNNALLYERLTQELALRRRLEGDREVIFNESVDFITIINKAGDFAQINPAFAGRLGFTPEALVGRNVFDFIHPDDRPFARYTFDQLPARKVIRGFCNRFLCAGNEIGYLENNLKYMEETGDTIAIARDVTNLREAEARNTDLRQSIALEKMKSEFFTGLSHEFKTPINIILSSLDFMRMKHEREDKERFRGDYGRFFEYAYQNCYRLLRLTTNLLDANRMDSQYFRLEPTPKELNALLGDIVVSAQGYAAGRGQSIAFHGTGHPLWAACDETAVDRIVFNLISNAIKHTPEGGHINVSLEEAGDFRRVAVSDDGSGVAPDFLPHIFDKFRTERSGLSERQGGSGLGLFLARALVELQGGSIWCESTLGEGSTFTFTLPASLPPGVGEEPPVHGDSHRAQARVELAELNREERGDNP